MGKIINFQQAKQKIIQQKRDEEIKKFNASVNFLVELIEAYMSEEEKQRRRELEEELEKALKDLI
jgi:hypothetical protein